MQIVIDNKIQILDAPGKFKTAVKERLPFHHVGVLRASANLEKGILILPEKQEDPTPGKGGRLPHICIILLHLSASNFSKYFFQLSLHLFARGLF